MASAKVLFDLNNQVFVGGLQTELPALLRELADKIEDEGPTSPQGLMDVNGNTVGLFFYSPSKDIDLDVEIEKG